MRWTGSTCSGWVVAIVCAACAVAGGAERKTYDLRYRPVVGQRWAFEQSTDTTLTIDSGVNHANIIRSNKETKHSQVIVTCEEILDVDAAGKCTAKRVTFGKGCFSFEQVDDKPRRDQRMICSEKTVTFKLLPDGTLDQDFGVKANGRHARIVRDAVLGRISLFPNHPVAVGDRWMADGVLRDVMQLQPGDTSSTILTLKAVRQQDGRAVADVGVTAAVLMTERGLNLEVGVEGTFVIDLETGMSLKEDLFGRSSIAGAARNGATMSGTGTFEFHRAARPLPPAPPSAVADTK